MYDHIIYIYILYNLIMVKKVVNPKVVIHLTIAPDLKQFLVDHNINASELLEEAIIELMDTAEDEKKEDIMEYYRDIKKRLENERIFTHPMQFEDKASFREVQIKAMHILRHKLGFSYEDSKKLLERYTKEKQKEVKKMSIENYRDY
jgi:hypothetical protein